MFQNAIKVEKDRRITYIFDGPEVEDQDVPGEIWNRRVKISVTHMQNSKRFNAGVMRVLYCERDGYAVERSAPFTEDYAIVLSEPVARFSAGRFQAFAMKALQECERIVNDESNVSNAAVILREALAFDLVKN